MVQPNKHSESARCNHCGYSLAGLVEGARCPECGTPSGVRPSVRFVDNLSDAPVSYLKRLRLGLLIQCLAMLAGAALMSYSVHYGIFRAGTLLTIKNIQHYLSGGFLLCGALWLLGSFVAAAPRPKGDRTSPDMLLDSPRLRRWAWLSQVFLPISVFMLWTTLVGPTGVVGWVLAITALLCMVAAAFALVPLAVYHSSIADWAGDTVLGDRMRSAAWTIAVIGTVGAFSFVGSLVPTVLQGLFSIAAMGAFVLSTIAVIIIALSFLLLANTVQWAILNNGSTAARNIRLANRLQGHLDEMAARSGGTLTLNADVCSGCGLDLAGLGSAGRCPECNTVFAKLGKPWSPEDLNDGIPLSEMPMTDVEHREYIERSPDGRTTKIRHITRAITVGRVKHRSSLGMDAGPTMFSEGPSNSVPRQKEPGIDSILDNLPDSPEGPNPSSGPANP